jgi:hypothetical protein
MTANKQTVKTAKTTSKTGKTSTKKVVETVVQKTHTVSKKSKKNSLANAVTAYLTTLLGSVLQESDLSRVVETLESNSSQIQKTINTRINQDAKKLRVKDPNAPKRNKSSYLIFCEERREHIKKNNPSISSTQLIRELGSAWKTVSAADKTRYEALAVKDKSRFESEMKSYVPPADLETRVRPKKAMNSYNFFYNETRSVVAREMPTLTTTAITSEVGKRWKALSDSEKSRYTKIAADAKAASASASVSASASASASASVSVPASVSVYASVPTPVVEVASEAPKKAAKKGGKK